MAFNYYGRQSEYTARKGNSLGCLVNGSKVTVQALDDATKIVRAGGKGVDVNDVMRSNVQTLQSAGVNIIEKNYKFYLDKEPIPTLYITPIEDKNEIAPVWR